MCYPRTKLAIPMFLYMHSLFYQFHQYVYLKMGNGVKNHYQEKNKKPLQGLALARMIGHVTYLSDLSMAEKFGRELLNGNFLGEKGESIEFKIESYLNYQGDKFAHGFDANSYILLTKMLDWLSV